MKAEFMLTGWMHQSFEIRFTEISNAIERNEIDRSVLQVCFMSPLCESSVEGLTAILKDRDDPTQLAIRRVYSKKVLRYYNAEFVLEYMVKEFNKSLNHKRHWCVGLVVAFFWTGFFVALRSVHGLKPHGETGYEIAVQYLTLVCATLQVWFQYMFYRQAVTDVKRKVYLMKQLSLMISPRIPNTTLHKLMPTVNIYCQISLRSWLDLRRIGLDYGRKYFYRHEIFLPVTMVLLLGNLVGVWVIVYYVDTDRQATWGYRTEDWRMLLYSMLLDACLFMVATFHFMYSAGALNDEFKVHIECLEKNRLLFKDILNLKEYYFSEVALPDSCGIRETFRAKSASKLRLRLVREISLLLQQDSTDPGRDLSEILEHIIKVYDDILEGINHDKEFDHVKILGITITRANTINMLVALASIVFACYQLAVESKK